MVIFLRKTINFFYIKNLAKCVCNQGFFGQECQHFDGSFLYTIQNQETGKYLNYDAYGWVYEFIFIFFKFGYDHINFIDDFKHYRFEMESNLIKLYNVQQ